MRKSCSPQNNKKKWCSKSGWATAVQQEKLKVTPNSQNSRPGETTIYEPLLLFAGCFIFICEDTLFTHKGSNSVWSSKLRPE